MFKIGDYVVNGKNGVCSIEDIQEINMIEALSVENKKEREKIYKNILKTCDPKSMVSIIKTFYC